MGGTCSPQAKVSDCTCDARLPPAADWARTAHGTGLPMCRITCHAQTSTLSNQLWLWTGPVPGCQCQDEHCQTSPCARLTSALLLQLNTALDHLQSDTGGWSSRHNDPCLASPWHRVITGPDCLGITLTGHCILETHRLGLRPRTPRPHRVPES